MAIQKIQPTYKFNEEQLKQLRQIAPEAFKDNILDFNALYEALSDSLEDDDLEMEHFGLSWPGKREAKKLASKPTPFTLKLNSGQGFSEDTTKNILIEGENLDVLKLLQKSYFSRVKMIYIDPPYNTGNDFIYNDEFAETLEEYLARTKQKDEKGRILSTNTKAGGRYHSKWLSMMYPRLKIAKNLLSDDGLIFVSIDDNEVHNLRTLLSEIFGEENFLTTFIWRRRKTQANLSKFIAPVHDYIVCFAKNIDDLVFKRLPFSKEFIEKTFSNPDNDPRGPYQTGPLARPANSSNREYELTMPNGRKIKAKWSCSQETFNTYVKENRLVIPRGGEGMPRIKNFLSELEGKLPNTWLDNIATNEEGSKEIEELFGSNAYFSAPKPTGLIKHLISLGVNDNDIVLDFFAGSGTTGHSVIDFNVGNSGRNIRYICVQIDESLNEKDAGYKDGFRKISDLTRERLTRAAKKIKKENKSYSGDLGFLFYSISPSNFKSWKNYAGNNVKQLETLFSQFESSLVDNWKPENLLTEILLIEGFPLDSKIESVETFKKNKVQKVTSDFCEHALFVCLDKKVEDETIKTLSLGDNDIFICLDNAVTDQDKARLDDKGLIKTI